MNIVVIDDLKCRLIKNPDNELLELAHRVVAMDQEQDLTDEEEELLAIFIYETRKYPLTTVTINEPTFVVKIY
jgi:hypothetical protein